MIRMSPAAEADMRTPMKRRVGMSAAIAMMMGRMPRRRSGITVPNI